MLNRFTPIVNPSSRQVCQHCSNCLALYLGSLIFGLQRVCWLRPNRETTSKRKRMTKERKALYGNRDTLGIEEKGGWDLFLGPDDMRERGPYSSPPLLSIPSFPTFLLGTCNRHSGWICVPWIPIREKQLVTGRLTFSCLRQSTEQRQDKDRTCTHAHFTGDNNQDRQ